MTFKASLDKLAKGITAGVIVLLASVIILLFVSLKAGHEIVSVTISIFLFVIFFIAYLIRPLSYEVTGDRVIINRPLKNVVIPRQVITSVQQVDKEMLKFSFRIFGVGGFFGYFGRFSNSRLGGMTWFATRRDNPVLLITSANKKIILTPDEPEAFVKQLSV